MSTVTAPKIFGHQLSRPVDNIATYEDSKRFCKPPKTTIKQRDEPPANYKLENIKARHNLRIVEEDLRRSRVNYQWMHRGFQMECDRLYMMANRLKREIQFCDTFVVKNEEKRRRFLLKMEHSRQTIKQRTEDAEELREKIAHLKKIKKMMEEKIAEYDIYELYLYNVALENPNKFKNAAGVLRRFEALYNSRQAIVKIEEDQRKRYQQSIDRHKKFLHEKFEQRTRLVTVLESLTRRYNEAIIATKVAENLVSSIHHESIQRKLELVTVRRTCWKLYRHMHSQEYTKAEVGEKDIKGQLNTISEVLGKLKEISTKLDIYS